MTEGADASYLTLFKAKRSRVQRLQLYSVTVKNSVNPYKRQNPSPSADNLTDTLGRCLHTQNRRIAADVGGTGAMYEVTNDRVVR